MLRKLK